MTERYLIEDELLYDSYRGRYLAFEEIMELLNMYERNLCVTEEIEKIQVKYDWMYNRLLQDNQ